MSSWAVPIAVLVPILHCVPTAYHCFPCFFSIPILFVLSFFQHFYCCDMVFGCFWFFFSVLFTFSKCHNYRQHGRPPQPGELCLERLRFATGSEASLRKLPSVVPQRPPAALRQTMLGLCVKVKMLTTNLRKRCGGKRRVFRLELRSPTRK